MQAANGEHVLAIDLGTSGPKVALVDLNGAVIGSEIEPVELLLSPGGGAEQRPDDWWRAIVTASRRLLGRGLCDAGRIVAVVCTSQWSGTVAVDAEGRPLHNAIIWMDSRGAQQIRALVGGWPSVDGYNLLKLSRWLRLTGGIPGLSGKDPVAHILWLRDNHPEVYERAHQFLEPKDYLNLRLTGRFAASYDSIALHWVTDNRDLKAVRYDDGLLALSGLDRRKLPELKEAVDVLGPITPQAAAELGVGEHVQVVMGTPDVHSAAIGSGAVADFEAHYYIGTSSWLTCHVPFKKTDIASNMASLPSAIPGRYFIANEQETSGACLSFLRDLFFADDGLTGPPPQGLYGRMDALASQVEAGSGGLLFLPWLNGERSPIDDHRLRGGFLNMSLRTTRAHMIRAVLEGVAYNGRWLLGAVEGFIGRPIESLRVIGGGANSALWCRILADVTGKTIHQVKHPIAANARGAAFLALVGLGYLTWDDVGQRVEIAHTFAPEGEARAVYEALYGEFRAAHRQNRKLFHRLNHAL
ncbi:MAG: xylulose kinase [Myxococcales bacterium]|nr:xylulose kinase [Myxococcales bacterium]